MDTIKLVIWDLDDTFWSGTLSEEGITPISENIELVKELTNRGIMNSIASKNDLERAKSKLQELEIWDYFVFPQINWNPKGNNVQQIIESAQLRANNVLFLDDNHLNLEEVKFYNDKIWVESPDFISKILNHESFVGKDDTSHSRLKQYKILEEKEKEKQNFSDNTDFLQSSNIQLAIIDDLQPIQERILELINRTNQINYTKKRITAEELEELLNLQEYECKGVRVKDRFGEYGIVGFYALHKAKHELEHFLFSCRSMNIGIEQYIYANLRFPSITVIGDITTELDSSKQPDWIQEVSDWGLDCQSNGAESKIKVLLKGACDLNQMMHYLSYKNLELQTEFNHVNQNNHQVQKACTEILLQSETLSPELKQELAQKIPFLDTDAFETELFNQDYDILVYSLLVDYTQDLFISKSTGVTVPYESYSRFPNESRKDFVNRCKKQGFRKMDEHFYDYFKKEFSYLGQIDEEHLLLNLSRIRKKVSKPIIFINGAEVPSPESNTIEHGKARKRHAIMNQALEKFCKEHPNTYILDVRKFVRSDDVYYSIRHYKRPVYEHMANELVAIIGKIQNTQLKKNVLRYELERAKKIAVYSLKTVAKSIVARTGLFMK